VHDVAATADALAVWRAVAAQAAPASKPSKPAMPKWGDED
jgi:dihydropteroate synthase